jgi:hypothetical protein
MPMGMRFVKATVLFLLLFPQTVFSQDKEVAQVVFYDGMKLYAKAGDGRTLEASVFLEPYQKGKSRSVSKFWGFDKEEPSWMIKEISLRIGGSRAIIPQISIADLADITLPGGFYIETTKKTVLLYLSGGDGAGSYDAVFRFIGKSLISRTITFTNEEGARQSVTQRMDEKWNPGRP